MVKRPNQLNSDGNHSEISLSSVFLLKIIPIHILILYFRKISREEFVGQEAKPKVMGTDAKAELAFNVFDKNHDGYITKNEMLKASKNLTKEQVNLNEFSLLYVLSTMYSRHFYNSLNNIRKVMKLDRRLRS